MRIYSVVATLLFLSTQVFGQNSPVFSNFMFFKQVNNPASVGSDEMLDFFALYRAQWVGINGSPSVQAFSVQSPLTVLNSSAGIFAANEMQGEERVTSVMLSYAYRLSFKKGSLAFGISGGMMQRAIDGSKLRSPNGDYTQSINHDDPLIPGSLSSGITGDANLGVYFHTKKLYAGVAVNNLLESNVKLSSGSVQAEIENPRHYTVMAGYRIKLSRKLYLLPNVSMKADFVNFQPELNSILQYKDNIYWGASFRGFAPDLKDALILMMGFKILKNLRVGYSYDFSLSSLNNVNGGSHEVYVRYGIKIQDLLSPGKIIYNPRNL